MHKDRQITIHAFPMAFYRLYPFLQQDDVHKAMHAYVAQWFHGKRGEEKALIDEICSIVGHTPLDVLAEIASATSAILSALEEKFSIYTDRYGLVAPDMRVMYEGVGDDGFIVIFDSTSYNDKLTVSNSLRSIVNKTITAPHLSYMVPMAFVDETIPHEYFAVALAQILEDHNAPLGDDIDKNVFDIACNEILVQLPVYAPELVQSKDYKWSYGFIDDHRFYLEIEPRLDDA